MNTNKSLYWIIFCPITNQDENSAEEAKYKQNLQRTINLSSQAQVVYSVHPAH